jgi:hypothetical protein
MVIGKDSTQGQLLSNRYIEFFFVSLILSSISFANHLLHRAFQFARSLFFVWFSRLQSYQKYAKYTIKGRGRSLTH